LTFLPNKFGVAHGINVKFGLLTFRELQKGRKIWTLLTFGCPRNKDSIHKNRALYSITTQLLPLRSSAII